MENLSLGGKKRGRKVVRDARRSLYAIVLNEGEEAVVIMLCRSIKDGLSPGSEPGYNCRECHEPIAVSPEGRMQIAHVGIANAMLLCTACGLRAADILVQHNGARAIQFNPDAVAAMEEGSGKCLLDLLPQAEVSFDPLATLRNPRR